MNHWTTVDQIVNWLRGTHLRRAVLRALEDGSVELLGGFSLIPPGNSPGLIVRVTSRHGIRYNVAIQPFVPCGTYARCVPRVPWENWVGDPKRSPPTIYDGDDPIRYAEKRNRVADPTTGRRVD